MARHDVVLRNPFIAQVGTPTNYFDLIGRVSKDVIIQMIDKDIEQTTNQFISKYPINQTYQLQTEAGYGKVNQLKAQKLAIQQIPEPEISSPVTKETNTNLKDLGVTSGLLIPIIIGGYLVLRNE